MQSWKARLGLVLTMLGMLLAVSVPAAAQEVWVQWPEGECWVDEWGSTWCPWDPALVAPAAAPVVEQVEVDEDEDDFATIESELDDIEDFFGDLEDIEEDFCDDDDGDDDCDDGDFVNALFDDDDDDCDDDDDGDCDDDDDDDDEFDFRFVDDEEEFEELFD